MHLQQMWMCWQPEPLQVVWFSFVDIMAFCPTSALLCRRKKHHCITYWLIQIHSVGCLFHRIGVMSRIIVHQSLGRPSNSIIIGYRLRRLRHLTAPKASIASTPYYCTIISSRRLGAGRKSSQKQPSSVACHLASSVPSTETEQTGFPYVVYVHCKGITKFS